MHAVTAASAAPVNHRLTTLSDMLARAPWDAVALSFGDEDLTYTELRAQVGRVANGLQCQGLQAGDVLGIWLPNTPRWLILHLACARLGVASLSLNLKLGVKELVNFIDRARCKALADEIETAALEIDEYVAAKDVDAGKLKQLQALLKGLA